MLTTSRVETDVRRLRSLRVAMGSPRAIFRAVTQGIMVVAAVSLFLFQDEIVELRYEHAVRPHLQRLYAHQTGIPDITVEEFHAMEWEKWERWVRMMAVESSRQPTSEWVRRHPQISAQPGSDEWIPWVDVMVIALCSPLVQRSG